MFNISSTSLYISSELKRLRKRLQNLGLNYRDAAFIAYTVDKLVKTRGSIGAISYLKKVSEMIKLYLLGEDSSHIHWVKTTNRYPTRFLFLQKYSWNTQMRLTKMHNFIVLSKPNSAQIDKFFSSVSSPNLMEADVKLLVHDLISHGISSFSTPWKCSQGADQPGFPLALLPLVEAQKKSELLQSKEKFDRKVSLQTSMDLVARNLALLSHPMWKRYQIYPTVVDSFYPLDKKHFARVSTEFYDELYQGKGSFLGRPDSISCMRRSNAPNRAMDYCKRENLSLLDPAYVGVLGSTQEPGGKLRVFASPYKVWQTSLEPLKRSLQDFLRMIPQDCTHDQRKGARFLATKSIDV